MDPVNPVGLARAYEDVSRLEKTRRTRRGEKRQDEYRPAKHRGEVSPNDEPAVDTFDPSEPSE
jgi:hypothetical protein